MDQMVGKGLGWFGKNRINFGESVELDLPDTQLLDIPWCDDGIANLEFESVELWLH